MSTSRSEVNNKVILEQCLCLSMIDKSGKQGPISSIKIVRYILNCAYVVFWEVRTSVSSKHLKLFVRTKVCVSLKTSYFQFCRTSVSKYHVIGHVRTLYSRVKWFNTDWKIRRYVNKVLKKKHVRIRMKARGPDLPPLDNHKFYKFPQIYAAVRMSNYEYRIGTCSLIFKIVH